MAATMRESDQQLIAIFTISALFLLFSVGYDASMGWTVGSNIFKSSLNENLLVINLYSLIQRFIKGLLHWPLFIMFSVSRPVLWRRLQWDAVRTWTRVQGPRSLHETALLLARSQTSLSRLTVHCPVSTALLKATGPELMMMCLHLPQHTPRQMNLSVLQCFPYH